MSTIYYLGVRFTKETDDLIDRFISLNDIIVNKPPKLGYHTTIVYSTQPFHYTISQLPKDFISIAGASLKLYGKSLVAPLSTGTYLSIMNRTVISNGAISDYQTYKPHITIAEDFEFNEIKLNHYIYIPIVLSEIFYLEWEEKS